MDTINFKSANVVKTFPGYGTETDIKDRGALTTLRVEFYSSKKVNIPVAVIGDDLLVVVLTDDYKLVVTLSRVTGVKMAVTESGGDYYYRLEFVGTYGFYSKLGV